MFEWYKFLFTTLHVSLAGMISIEHVINSSIGSEDCTLLALQHQVRVWSSTISTLEFFRAEHGPPASDIWKYVDI